MPSECVTDSEGTKVWVLNDKLHREDGPAAEWVGGTKFWYLNGKYHRLDGPACEYASGYKEWWLNGEQYTFKQWLEYVWDSLPIEQQEKYIFNGFEDAE